MPAIATFPRYNESGSAGAGNTLRSLTHSLDYGKEGLGMKSSHHETKTCAECGTVFSRSHNERAKRWSSRRFCSKKCSLRTGSRIAGEQRRIYSPDTTIKCAACGEPKTLESYSRVPGGAYGRAATCKNCSAAERERRATATTKTCTSCGKDKKLQAFATRGGRCKTCQRQHDRAHYAANREEINARARAREPKRYAPDPSVTSKVCTTCSEHQSIAEFSRNSRSPDGYQDRCKSCTSEYKLGYREEHPETGWRGYYRARAIQYGHDPVIGDFTRAEVIEAYGDGCFYCDGDFEHLDHYIPVKNGGTHTLENVRPSCATCNHRKWDTDGDEWVARGA